MKTLFRVFAFLLAFALTGAPMGMARMMEGHEAGAHEHHQQQPAKSATHVNFVVCAACAGLTAPTPDVPFPLPIIQAASFARAPAPDGTGSAPPLPPPRA